MDLGNYGIGGNEVKIDASEGIAEIPQNRTLLVEQLTKDEPVAPEVIAGLTNIDEVFAHFRPEIDIEFSDADIIRKSKFPQNPKRSVRFSGKRTKRSVQKRKARNTQKAETKVL